MDEMPEFPTCLPMFKPSQIEGEFPCIYCGKVFTKLNAMRIHLGNCKKRALHREFIFGEITFHVYMNPRRDVYLPLKEYAQKAQGEPKCFVGALEYLKCAGWVTQYLLSKSEG